MKDHVPAIFGFWNESVRCVLYKMMSSHSLAPVLSSSIQCYAPGTQGELWVFEWIRTQLKANWQSQFTGNNSILNTRCHCSILLTAYQAPVWLKLGFQALSKTRGEQRCSYFFFPKCLHAATWLARIWANHSIFQPATFVVLHSSLQSWS